MAGVLSMTIAIFGVSTTVTVGQAILMAVMMVISMVMSMLNAPDPVMDKGVKQRIPTDPKTKLNIIYGKRKFNGMISFADISDDDQVLYFIIPIVEGPIESCNEVFWASRQLKFDGDINTGLVSVTDSISDNGQGESDDFLNEGRFKMRFYPRGGRCVEMEANSSKWSTDARNRTMPNTAYAYIELTYNQEKRVTGLESKLFFHVTGKRVRTFKEDGSFMTVDDATAAGLSHPRDYSYASYLQTGPTSARYLKIELKEVKRNGEYYVEKGSYKHYVNELRAIDNNGDNVLLGVLPTIDPATPSSLRLRNGTIDKLTNGITKNSWKTSICPIVDNTRIIMDLGSVKDIQTLEYYGHINDKRHRIFFIEWSTSTDGTTYTPFGAGSSTDQTGECFLESTKTSEDINTSTTEALIYSNNPAECLVDYLTNKIYGCSISDEDLDIGSFYRHKKFCKSLVKGVLVDAQTYRITVLPSGLIDLVKARSAIKKLAGPKPISTEQYEVGDVFAALSTVSDLQDEISIGSPPVTMSNPNKINMALVTVETVGGLNPGTSISGSDITETGTLQQERYTVNGLIGTEGEMDQNIYSIVMNSGAWFTYGLGKFGVISDRSETRLASNYVTSDNDKDGILKDKLYMISKVGSNETSSGVTFTSFGASATPEIGEIFTATMKSGIIADSNTVNSLGFSGEAIEIQGEFSEDNMIGAISISSGGFEHIVNRLTLKYSGKDNSQEEEEQLIIDTRDQFALEGKYYIDPTTSGGFVNEDEPLLEKTINMDLTNNSIQAERLATININNARQNITVEFKTDLSWSGLQPGDIVAIHHTTPGWGYQGDNFDIENPIKNTPKLFRVIFVEEVAENGTVSLTINAQEYASENYEDRLIQVIDAAPNTNFANPSRAPMLGVIGTREEVVRYESGDASSFTGNLSFSVLSQTETSVDELLPGKQYVIEELELDTTTQTAWRLISGEASLVPQEGDTFTSILAPVVDGFVDTTQAWDIKDLFKDISYTITALGTTTQDQWNEVAGTTGATYVVGSHFVSAFALTNDVSYGTGTMTTTAGLGKVFLEETFNVTLDTDPLKRDAVTVGIAIREAITAGIEAGTITSIRRVESDPFLANSFLVTFDETEAKSGRIYCDTAVFNIGSGDLVTRFRDASLIAESSDGIEFVNGLPVSSIRVSFEDNDPYLDNVDIRWFKSSDTAISMDKTSVNYVGDIGIGRLTTTNVSPVIITGLEVGEDYQIEIRGVSHLGQKGVAGYPDGIRQYSNDDYVRFDTVTIKDDNIGASIYSSVLTNPLELVPTVQGDAGIFSAVGDYSVVSANKQLSQAEGEVYYTVERTVNIPAGGAAINSDGEYEVTELNTGAGDSRAGFAYLRANVTGNVVALADIVSGKFHTITSLGDTDWVAMGYPTVSHDIAGMVIDGLYKITSLGTTSQAIWNEIVGTTGVTYVVNDYLVAEIDGDTVGTPGTGTVDFDVPQVGSSFQATAKGTGTGTLRGTRKHITEIFKIKKEVDASSLLRLGVVHEQESSAASGTYVSAPEFFRNDLEYQSASITQNIDVTLAGHNYEIVTVGGNNDDWNTLAGTSGVTYVATNTFLSVVDGSTLTGSPTGSAKTTERNYRLRAELYIGGNLASDEWLSDNAYTYIWYKDGVQVATGVGLTTLEVNAEDITNSGSSSFKVTIDVG